MQPSEFETLTGQTDLDFPEYEAPPPDPAALVRAWLAAAERRGVREPRSMALATADSRGHASNRIVTITGVTGPGLVFASHSCSRKGRELAETGWASGLLYWRETGQQLILSGPVTPLPPAESEALWHGRAVALHPMSVASRQSEPLADPAALRTQATLLAEPETALPRPPRFTGYRLDPTVVEFWCASSDRMHRRLRYERQGPAWTVTRLQP